MQDVYSFCELRHIEDSMLQSGANSQLVNARAHADHGLPVIWLKPLLNQVKLMAGKTPRIVGEGSQVLEGGACPEERFHGHLDTIQLLVWRRKGSEEQWQTPHNTSAAPDGNLCAFAAR
jgi:hypothetical protein